MNQQFNERIMSTVEKYPVFSTVIPFWCLKPNKLKKKKISIQHVAAHLFKIMHLVMTMMSKIVHVCD